MAGTAFSPSRPGHTRDPLVEPPVAGLAWEGTTLESRAERDPGGCPCVGGLSVPGVVASISSSAGPRGASSSASQPIERGVDGGAANDGEPQASRGASTTNHQLNLVSRIERILTEPVKEATGR
jgi:hypothetical protein